MKTKPFLILIFTFSIPLSLAAMPFSDNGNGTISDQKTGLLWQKCSMGQNVDATCSGTATTATWVNAIFYCENLTLAGHSDWRLPNLQELKSIVDRSKSSGATINLTYFNNTQPNVYWTSTAYAPSPALGWFVYFGLGNSADSFKTLSYYVRCVAAGP